MWSAKSGAAAVGHSNLGQAPKPFTHTVHHLDPGNSKCYLTGHPFECEPVNYVNRKLPGGQKFQVEAWPIFCSL